MEKYAIDLSDKRMYFIYICGMHDENSWKKSISFGYYKMNFFIDVDAKIIIDNVGYFPRKYDFMTYSPFSDHYGVLSRRQKAEYFEFLIPDRFFECMDQNGDVEKTLKRITSKRIFSLPSENRKAFVDKIYFLRDKLRDGCPEPFVIAEILSVISDMDRFCDNQKAHLSTPLSDKIVPVISYITENSAQIKSINEIAQTMNVSRAYLSKLFRTETGCTPRDYLMNAKLENSLVLLSEGKNVTEACFASGFNNCSVYIENFKRKYGDTPYKFCRRTSVKK